jgi:BNR repeat-like domain
MRDPISSWRLKFVKRVPLTSGPSRHRAFPSLERLPSGELVVMYREGSDHWSTNDGSIREIRSHDRGESWTEPQTILQEPGRNFGTTAGLTWLPDGSLVQPVIEVRDFARRKISTSLMRSRDAGRTWNASERPGLANIAADQWWNTAGKLVMLDRATVLWPVARQRSEGDPWETGLLVSNDGGQTFERFVVVAKGLGDGKSIVSLSDGRLLAHIRDIHSTALYQSFSSDRGMSWTSPQPSGIVGQTPFLFRTRRGVLLCAHRDKRPNRGGVGLAMSFDSGEKWHSATSLYESPDKKGDCASPAMVQFEDGLLMCVYYTEFLNGNSNLEAVFLQEE